MLYVYQDSVCVFAARVQTPLVLVSLHVQGEVVRSGEGARADGALEGFGARVLPVMARQLVRTSKTPVAAVPRAPVGLLTRVSPEVGFQMGRLGVDLLAAWVITVVDPPFLQVRVVPPVVAGRHGGLSWGWGWSRCRGLGKACGLAWDRRWTCGEGQGQAARPRARAESRCATCQLGGDGGCV